MARKHNPPDGLKVVKAAGSPPKLVDNFSVFSRTGEYVCHLNPTLARRQQVTDEQLAALRFSHSFRVSLFELARKTRDKRKLRALAAVFEELEFHQQKEWNFPQDASFHRWFDFPHCCCPKMDNEDSLGVKAAGRIIRLDCPVHVKQ